MDTFNKTTTLVTKQYWSDPAPLASGGC